MKTRKKRSKIWLLPEEDFRAIVEKSSTMREALSNFSLENKGGNHRTFKDRMISLGYNLSVYAYNGSANRNSALRFHNPAQPLSSVLVMNSTYSRHTLKKRIRAENLLPYVCVLCGHLPEWQGKELVLTLDHTNGISDDNRLDNLRFLCPNCNSQQDTFAGRNYKRTKTEKPKIKRPSKIVWPSLESLLQQLSQSSYSQVAKSLGVSDTAIRKFIARS